MKNKKKIIIFIVAIVIFALSFNKNRKQQTQTCISSFNYKIHQENFKDSKYSGNSLQNEMYNLNRNEILKKTVKGFRDETYWGSEHPISDKSKEFSDKEFSTFVQEDIKDKDIDDYWGAEY